MRVRRVLLPAIIQNMMRVLYHNKSKRNYFGRCPIYSEHRPPLHGAGRGGEASSLLLLACGMAVTPPGGAGRAPPSDRAKRREREPPGGRRVREGRRSRPGAWGNRAGNREERNGTQGRRSRRLKGGFPCAEMERRTSRAGAMRRRAMESERAAGPRCGPA